LNNEDENNDEGPDDKQYFSSSQISALPFKIEWKQYFLPDQYLSLGRSEELQATLVISLQEKWQNPERLCWTFLSNQLLKSNATMIKEE